MTNNSLPPRSDTPLPSYESAIASPALFTPSIPLQDLLQYPLSHIRTMAPDYDVPGRWIDSSDSYTDLVCSITEDAPVRAMSATMQEDKSQPPTPDGTGLPANFHLVGPGIYRSSYPQAAHFAKLAKFHLKTIITFLPEETMPEPNKLWYGMNEIMNHHIPILANKDPEVKTPYSTIETILSLMLNRHAAHPILIHCNKGKHRTGCVTACFRKVTGWTDAAVLAEYEKYSTPKDRVLDRAFIRAFEPSAELKAMALEGGFVGGAWAQPKAWVEAVAEDEGSGVQDVGKTESDYTYVTGPGGASDDSVGERV